MSESYCRENFDGAINTHRNIIENRVYHEDRTIDQFIIENKEALEFAEKNRFQIVEIEKTFESMFDSLKLYLDNIILR